MATSPSQSFVELFCIHNQTLTPHWAGRVLAQQGNLVAVELHCRKCGAKIQYSTQSLPAGYQVYQVRVTGEDNSELLAEFRPQPLVFLEEEFAVVGSSAQQAHEAAEFATALRLKGHLARWFVNGELHPDERF